MAVKRDTLRGPRVPRGKCEAQSEEAVSEMRMTEDFLNLKKALSSQRLVYLKC